MQPSKFSPICSQLTLWVRYTLWILVGINSAIFILRGWRPFSGQTESDIAYTDENYPFELPLEFDAVGMTLLRNTTRFEMNLSSNISLKEWETLSIHPFVVHLGANGRAFSVAYYHQWHCVHVLTLTFLRGEYKRLTNEHVQHCLNYLRQSFLCMSDDSLELGDSMAARGDIFGGVGICRDWEKVNELVDINLADWLKWNASNSSL
ncbi:hypothetical protein B0H14DRAFT_2520811 [Mycena olivaceomarginata]|nr:hypothetical protein B0H14DRAFT_2520811 [Mycena olivaceomarginata]